MRKTYCVKCERVWEEDRSISIKDSKCPRCGTKVTEMFSKKKAVKRSGGND